MYRNKLYGHRPRRVVFWWRKNDTRCNLPRFFNRNTFVWSIVICKFFFLLMLFIAHNKRCLQQINIVYRRRPNRAVIVLPATFSLLVRSGSDVDKNFLYISSRELINCDRWRARRSLSITNDFTCQHRVTYIGSSTFRRDGPFWFHYQDDPGDSQCTMAQSGAG